MKYKITKKSFFIVYLIMCTVLVGCKANGGKEMTHNNENAEKYRADETIETIIEVTPTTEITQLKDGFSTVSFDGDYGFDAYLEQGGASTDAEVIKYLTQHLISNAAELDFQPIAFGCSTIAADGENGERLFGRNFDWNHCNAMVVLAKPNNGYQSISTVNMDFIRQGAKGIAGLALNSHEIQTIAALYAPLDGMNEKGLCISVNMIQDSDTIEQNTKKSDITTTTAIRLLLDKAADTEEALTLLEQYDMHSSMGMMIHFAIADAKGNSVVVEYIDNKMIVTKTPVVTNFYLSEGEKNGIGTQQSHERYNILIKDLNKNKNMNVIDIKEALDSVSKDNFGEFESTEWSIVFNQESKEARYYHRENYENCYLFRLQ